MICRIEKAGMLEERVNGVGRKTITTGYTEFHGGTG
jgi:hypothetical protein